MHSNFVVAAGHDRTHLSALTCSRSTDNSFATPSHLPARQDRGNIYQKLAAVLARRSHGAARRVLRGSRTLRRELEESQEVREEVPPENSTRTYAYTPSFELMKGAFRSRKPEFLADPMRG